MYGDFKVKNCHFSLPHPDLMQSLRVILSEFPEPYVAKNWDDGAIPPWRPRDPSLIHLVRIPAWERRMDRNAMLSCGVLKLPECKRPCTRLYPAASYCDLEEQDTQLILRYARPSGIVCWHDLKWPLNKCQGHSIWYQSILSIPLPIGCQ